MTGSAGGWDELVTTALLGTGRRPLPAGLPPAVAALARDDADPAHAVLDAAAGFTAYRHAGRLLPTVPEAPLAPRQRLDPAPAPAQTLLDRLLHAHDVPLLDAWLRACAEAGLGARPGLWVRLAHAAAPARGVDRRLVCDVLGERGRAFCALRRVWAPVLAAAAADPRPHEQWDDASSRAVVGRLASGTLRVVEARPLAAALGRHGSFAVADDLRELARLEHEAGQSWGFADAARLLLTRLDIHHAFQERP